MAFKDKIRIVPDFPKPGIRFVDITTLLKEAGGYKRVIDAIAKEYRDDNIDLVVSPEARGFIIGAAVAYALGSGFAPVRKPGKLPAAVIDCQYDLEYGTNSLQIHKDAIIPGQKVLLIDDLLATGGTALAAVELVTRLQGEVAGLAFLAELTYLTGRKMLAAYKVVSLIKY